MSEPIRQPVYVFEGFRLDAHRRVLHAADGQAVPLTPRVLDTLPYFVERAGQLLTKEQLMEALWPNVVVEEHNLNKIVSELRRVLGEKPGEPKFIVTKPGQGYRLVASVAMAQLSSRSTRALALPLSRDLARSLCAIGPLVPREPPCWPARSRCSVFSARRRKRHCARRRCRLRKGAESSKLIDAQGTTVSELGIEDSPFVFAHAGNVIHCLRAPRPDGARAWVAFNFEGDIVSNVGIVPFPLAP